MKPGLSVAFINNFPGPSLGGGEVQLVALLRGLVEAGVAPSVVCVKGSRLELDIRGLDGVNVLPVDFSFHSLPSLLSCIAAGLRGVQVVQGTGFLTNLVARWVGTRVRVPVVNIVHVMPGAARLDGGSLRFLVLRAMIDRSTRRVVACYVAVSEAVREGLLADGISPSRVTVVRNGVDLVHLRRVAAGSVTTAAPTGGTRVGFIGRLERIKGCEFFVRAASLLAEVRPDVRFVVAGAGSREFELRALAEKEGVADRIEFLGYVTSVPALLASLDIVVVPSLSEASGLAAIEALGLGVPVIASCVGGLTDVVLDGETGLLVAPGDAAAIAHAVSRLVDDPGFAHALSAAGIRRVEERFTVTAMVRGYQRLYEELVS